MKKSQARLKAEYMAEAEELFDELMAWDESTAEPDMAQIEEIVLRLRKRIGKRMAETVLAQQESGQPVERIRCPECEKEMENKGQKESDFETRVGNLKIERSHYYCPRCRRGFFPLG
ncbi:MAG: hypothetical protein ISR58_20555 [Anaerolineales bacterium]|nr:hypothetical protein [Anaerolineales bacterium]